MKYHRGQEVWALVTMGTVTTGRLSWGWVHTRITGCGVDGLHYTVEQTAKSYAQWVTVGAVRSEEEYALMLLGS